REVRAAIDLAKKHRNVNAIVVGNEAIYRHEFEPVGEEGLDPEELSKLREAMRPDAEPDALRKAKEDIAVGRLVKVIQRVKRESPVPVTTGEVWNIWKDHPELVRAVDFIAVHILPYWEGKPNTAAVDDAVASFNQLRQLYPGKRIVIAEFGWPSAGYNFKSAN